MSRPRLTLEEAADCGMLSEVFPATNEKYSAVAAAKTTTERVQELRQRRETLQLKRLELYAHEGDHEAIKAYAAKLQRKRERKPK
jgi:hypothetical protein